MQSYQKRIGSRPARIFVDSWHHHHRRACFHPYFQYFYFCLLPPSTGFNTSFLFLSSYDTTMVSCLLYWISYLHKMSKVTIRTTPAVKDPRQLESIIIASLRSLFGDCQAYSCELRVLECRPCPSSGSIKFQNSYDAILECPNSSVEHIRAALTFSSTPKFLDGEIYRIDFLHCDAREWYIKLWHTKQVHAGRNAAWKNSSRRWIANIWH